MTDMPVATRYTYEFVRSNLPQGARQVLEVGCGRGALAARLMEDGYAVVALDSDAECAAAARAAGVDARQLEWPAKLGCEFDAILFTRSLHHVHDLDESLAAAKQTLRPVGRLIVEDFRAEGAPERSNIWYRGLTRLLAASGAFGDEFDLHDRLAAPEPAAYDDHHLHSSAAIAEALGCFSRVGSEDAAYFFRYLEHCFRCPNAAEELLAHELSLMNADTIDALGKRFVASDA